MQKRERQNMLLELIGNERIGSQIVLASRLSESGFKVTQASVSRDLDELGVVKANGAYVLPMRTNETANDFNTVRFDTAGECMIVGRCASGLASAVTVRIDAAKIVAVVGTIAGDDTIFIAVKNVADQAAVLQVLKENFAGEGAFR